MPQSNSAKAAIEQHQTNRQLIQQWLVANGFTCYREVVSIDARQGHSETFAFYRRGDRLAVMHRITPDDKCESPTPFVDVYIPLESSNNMEETRKSIEGYAR